MELGDLGRGGTLPLSAVVETAGLAWLCDPSLGDGKEWQVLLFFARANDYRSVAFLCALAHQAPPSLLGFTARVFPDWPQVKCVSVAKRSVLSTSTARLEVNGLIARRHGALQARFQISCDSRSGERVSL